ncbi:hypothetical protein KVT40_004906 [Elsinoe batatas]|uniref:polynucleotide adenylyltransferase n=1 Tax=Elsinoe batatas TaxID=2601811 RepID=A0A8K0L3A5_9PEZI|nr:hypothetical protein KVT40_004906 [Elsinoe batatas]
MAATERLYQHRSPHSAGVPVQSSSVPSTPHQHPRDLQFRARSPSPGRGLGPRSPRANAARPLTSVPQQTQPVVCKFETGAEFRKRRIPYKDGGNDPLPSPKTRPKAALEPDEEDKLSGDMRELYDRILPSDESEERRAKLVKKLEKILNDEWPGNDIKVNVFGSSGNLLSSSDSDVDICITTSFKKLESMHSLATVLHQHGMERVVCRAAAKVPIVKAWDPELQLACDMNVNNTLALENTRMIKTYVQIDDRVRPLAKIIKYWTKQRILNDAAYGGTISSYTWICMIINFLQTRNPPILPSLQKLDQSLRLTIDGKQSEFADDLTKLQGHGKENKESLGTLLFCFFRYYGFELDYQTYVVSVKEGRLLSRKEKGWNPDNYQDKEARTRLCVEEPFNTIRNLGNSADDYAFSGIHEEIRRAFGLVAEGRLDECCAEFVFPPEEKPLFQRPPPKPKPTLTRSASQSAGGGGGSNNGRSHAASVVAKGGGREHRNNRTSSSHRGNNRRASSGAAFGNPRFQFMSPPIGMNGADYFASSQPIPNDQLHEQLYKQYQHLQAQQELLRTQLLQQQQSHTQLQAAQAQAQVQAYQQAQVQAQAQAHGIRTTEYSTASPRHRQFANSLSSPRTLDNPPNTAPLLPGYLYHYPARYPGPGSPLSHNRSQDGTMTDPSSPSVSSNMSSARRGTRASLPEGNNAASARSQSQPGRTLHNPLTLQSLVHPGYDVSGAIGMPVLSQQQLRLYQQQQNGYDLTSPMSQGFYDAAMPKEYVGYFMGQSPQLMPQQHLQQQHVPVLHDVTPRPKQSTEQFPPALANGSRRQSRSPSPLEQRRSSSISTNARSAPLPQMPFPEVAKKQRKQPRPVEDGPVIVNGSTPKSVQPGPAIVSSSAASTPVKTNGSTNGLGQDRSENQQPVSEPQTPERKSRPPPAIVGSHRAIPTDGAAVDVLNVEPSLAVKRSPPSQEGSTPNGHSHTNGLSTNAWQSNPGISPSVRARPPPPLNLSPNAALDDSCPSPADTRSTQISPLVTAPLLSPVAELQTPSPTSSRGHNSPKKDGREKARSVQVANGRLNERVNSVMTNGSGNHHGTALSYGQLPPPPKPLGIGETLAQKGSYPAQPAQQPAQQPPQWQQATRKHRKGKSQGSVKELGQRNGTGEVMPADESERKGG